MPNATTKQSPAKLFLGRELRSSLDLMRPDLRITVQNNTWKELEFFEPEFKLGEKVVIRDYTAANQKWIIGVVIAKDGNLHYTIKVGEKLLRRYVQQM